MSNKDYNQLYTELLLENKKLQLEIEAQRCIIGHLDDNLNILSKLANSVRSTAFDLYDKKNEMLENRIEFSRSIYTELEEEKNKINKL